MANLVDCTCSTAGHKPYGCIACRYRLCLLSDDPHQPGAQEFKLLKRGEHISFDAATQSKAWIVISGTIALCTTLADGRRQIVGLELVGDIFGTLNAGHGADSWIEALAESRLCAIDLSAHRVSQANADQLDALLAQLRSHLSALALHVITLGRLDSMERICLFLADMARRSGQGDNGRLRVSLPMSREDIADYLGLNPETVSRLFGRIKKAGAVIFLSPTEYLVPDISALEKRIPIVPFADPSRRQPIQLEDPS